MIRGSLAAVLALLASVPEASAQPEPAPEVDAGVEPSGSPLTEEPADPDAGVAAEEQASLAFERGQRAFEDDDYTGALAAFEEAMRLAPSDVVRFNIALCLERLGRFRQALAEYEAAAASTELPPETRADAERRAQRVRGRVATLVVPGPAGAHVEVEGAEGCTAPCRITVDPGTHQVRRIDGDGRVVTVAVARGEERTVELQPREEDPGPVAGSSGPSLRLGLVGWIGGGVALVGTLSTIALGLRVQSIKEDYDAAPNRDDLDEGRAMVVATNVALAFAILGAASVALDVFVLQRRSRPEPTAETPGQLSFAF